MFRLPKARTVVSRLATASLVEGVKAAISALAAAELGSAAAGSLAGAISKEVVSTLLVQASAVEAKLDRLLREPLIAGMELLREALLPEMASSESTPARGRLLEQSHLLFVRAWALVEDSRDDSLYIRALDSVALAAHSQYRKLARQKLSQIRVELDDRRLQIEALEHEAVEWVETSRVVDEFFGRDSLRDKPFGHAEQRLWARSVRDEAKAVRERAERARTHLTLLDGVASLAEAVMNVPGPASL